MGNCTVKTSKCLGNNKGQSVLETSIVFIAMVLLIGGVINMWLWANNQVIKRQIEYNESRVMAGTSGLETWTYRMQWPLERDENITESSQYSPFPANE